MRAELDQTNQVRLPATSFRDLRVWRSAIPLVKEVYSITRGLPRSEVFGLARQMQRAAVSIPSNIAEGHAREHRKEYLHFLAFAQGSLAELDTQLEIAFQLEYLSSDELVSMTRMTGFGLVGRQLRALRKSLKVGITAVRWLC